MPETIDYKGYQIRIVSDDYPECPRYWDNLGTMVCWHRCSYLGDTNVGIFVNNQPYHATAQDLTNYVHSKEVAAYYPLYIYEHGGMTMKITPFGDPCSEQVGYIYVTKETVKRKWRMERISRRILEAVEELLRSEVEIYDMWLRGEVYGYIVLKDEEEIETSHRWFGYKKVEKQGKKCVDYIIKHNTEQAWKTLQAQEELVAVAC